MELDYNLPLICRTCDERVRRDGKCNPSFEDSCQAGNSPSLDGKTCRAYLRDQDLKVNYLFLVPLIDFFLRQAKLLGCHKKKY